MLVSRSLFVLFALVSLSLAQSECSHSFTDSGNTYSLDDLKAKVGGADQTVVGSNNATYYYHVCGTVTQPECTSTNFSNTAVCQRSTQTPPNYYSCGQHGNGDDSWTESTPPGTGFVLLFNKGMDDRRADVTFICGGGEGRLGAMDPTEDPTHYYHLKWEGTAGCPKQSSSSSSAASSSSGNTPISSGSSDGNSDGGRHGDGDSNDGGLIAATVLGWLAVCFLSIVLLAVLVVTGLLYMKLRGNYTAL